MEQKGIDHIVKRIFRKLNNYLSLIKLNYDTEVIHNFRVEVKNLRALLRLLSTVLDDPDDLKLPRSLKEIYASAGRIRDIQLQITRMEEAGKQILAPGYLLYLQFELGRRKKAFHDLFKAKSYAKAKEKIMENLPEPMPVPAIIDFYNKKMGFVRSLLAAIELPDEDWHRVRKVIKDLVYIFKTLNEEISGNLQATFWNEEQLAHAGAIAHELGRFNDVCIALNFLRPSWLIEFIPQERKQLQSLRLAWLSHKRNLKVLLTGQYGPSILTILKPVEVLTV